MTGHWTRACGAAALLLGAAIAHSDSLDWKLSSASNFDYGRQVTIPTGFGDGEFTLELWIRPDDNFPIGSTASGAEQLNNWSNTDLAPYSSDGWWFAGNFLLDGHNNAGSNFQNGTFTLQFYGSGRVRWLFGDGAAAGARVGSVHSVGAPASIGAPSLLDGQWHHLAMVRRFSGVSSSSLELWIDGVLIDTETSTSRTDMRQWWDNWSGFPANQRFWAWGAEKQAAVGQLSQYEDYKGLIDELRFWSHARTTTELSTEWNEPVNGTESGLVGWYAFSEGSGSSACNTVTPAQCMSLVNTAADVWNASDAPTGGVSPDTTAPSQPDGVSAIATSATAVGLVWNASTDNIAVTGYRVRRGGVTVGNPTGTSYNDTGLTPNTRYSYTVEARDAANNYSAPSNAAQVSTPVLDDTTAPTVPSAVVAVAQSSTTVNVTWTASVDTVGVQSYRVMRGAAVAGNTTGLTFSEAGLTANTTYNYTVSAVDAAGNRSAESAVASVTTLAAPASPPPAKSGGGGRLDVLTLLLGLILTMGALGSRFARAGARTGESRSGPFC